MQRHFERRIATLEQSIVPLSASVLLARAQNHARRTGKSFGSEFESLISKVNDDELERLTIEFEQMAFGSDTAARDAAKRETLAAAGYPVWNLPGAESADEG